MGQALMIQGTGSSVGKSLICAALCRVFSRRGIRVAPFKAQNMSNNAFVTVDGGEISRAQAAQAEAAGVAPSVDMNPVLLKPEGERGSQVILHGRVWGHLRGSDFLDRKQRLWAAVARSLRTLLHEFDLVVIEGAGSPAEINLRAGDIVNMRVAHAAQAPVLLVGDIDRGGVFASLIGTLELLEPKDRERVRGFIVNRFRGDPVLLKPGLEFLEQRTGLPVLGVVPNLARPGLAEEDAATLDSIALTSLNQEPGRPRVAAVRLPRLANFDDLDPLVGAGASVAWVQRPADLGRPDLIVLPGSKQSAGDLAWLQTSGLGAAIVELADRGTPVLGLCGGYQMLGESIDDPDGVESDLRSVCGLGLLPVRTVLRDAKTTRQTRGQVLAGRGLFAGAAGAEVSGYEIHVGQTTGPGQPLLELASEFGPHPDGRAGRSGWIAGTYLHGLLGNRPVLEALLSNLADRRGSAVLSPGSPSELDPYDRLADHIEAALDMELLFRLAGLERSS